MDAEPFRQGHPPTVRHAGGRRDEPAAKPAGRGREGRARRRALHDDRDRPARRAHGRERTRIARRRARQAHLGGEVHHGIEPATGLLAGDQLVGGSLQARRRRRHAEDARHDPAHVHIERSHRHAERGGSDRPRRVRPDPRERLEGIDRRRHPAPVLRDDRPGRVPQRQGAPVVAQPGPCREELLRTGAGEVARRRPAVDEPPPHRPDPLDPGLLGHDLGDQDLPRVRGRPDEQRTTCSRVPAEQPRVEPSSGERRGHAPTIWDRRVGASAPDRLRS